MEDILSSLFDGVFVLYGRALAFCGWLLISMAGVVPGLVALYLVWLLVSAAHRRQQRARCFIDLIEIGLKEGRTVEQTVLSLATNRVKDMGVRFHLLAAWMEGGLRLSAALAEVPRFLPAHIRSMLRVGEEIGDPGRVLPVCRATLTDGFSSTQKNVNNLMVLLFVSPVGPALVWVMAIFVFPKFREIMRDMMTENPVGDGGVVAWSSAPFEWSLVLANITLAAWFVFLFATCLQGFVAWLLKWVLPGWARLSDAASFRIPWMRQRMLRDFSALLALLLDAGIPEEKSVRLAAEGTGNRTVVRRAERVIDDLKKGVKLTEAVRWLDDAGEFRWRLTNACHAPNRFAAALAGWHEALEARAFQQEQMFSQAITTGFVLMNGLMVGLATVGVFKALVGITEMALW
jgi:type II secretory pathway component PulF